MVTGLRLQNADEEQEHEPDNDNPDHDRSEEARSTARLIVIPFTPVPQLGIVRVRRYRAYGSGHRSSLSSPIGRSGVGHEQSSGSSGSSSGVEGSDEAPLDHSAIPLVGQVFDGIE